MSCIDKGILRAKLDGELHGRELEQVESHLATCATCRHELEEMSAIAERVQHVLDPLAPLPNEVETEPAFSLARFRAQEVLAGSTQLALGFFDRIAGRRWAPALGGALAVGMVVIAISFAPVRSWGERLLAMLRVEKIEVVSIDPVLPDTGTQERAGKMLGQLISDNVVVTMQGKAQQVASVDQASELAGFDVRRLTARNDTPKLSVEGEQAFHLTLNRERLQAIVDEVGRSDIQLPASIDGAEVAVHIPRAVTARYGDIGKSKETGETSDSEWKGATPQQLQNFLVFAQVPSPTVSVPPNLNIAEVAEAGLEVGGMSPSQAQALVQSVDWTSTLVIPVPHEGGSLQKEQVDGVEGTLITAPPRGRRPQGYTLIWTKNGVIYSLAGFGDGSDAAGLADSLN
ncbi:MAG TPA: zf-HC2 domain-containing protein [Terriglobia bacterium]|nr:zf-HC2 domain-containing protein [Terriglobia bacterium]